MLFAHVMTEGTTPEVGPVSYNPASQMTNVCYFEYCEARTYNSMGQLAEISDATVHRTYTYPAGVNNGKISQSHNVCTKNQRTVYTYDATSG